jgi:hypothetical protein
VQDISNAEIVINCPKDEFSTKSENNIFFWWEPLSGAESYNLQIVSPDFEDIMQLRLDVSIDSCKYTINLPPGNYQWRIRAYNGSFSTSFITRTITINDNK